MNEEADWPENQQHYDRLIKLSARNFRDALLAGGPEAIKAQYAFMCIAGILVADHLDVHNQPKEFLAYMRQKYNQATGESLPSGSNLESEEALRHLIRKANSAFNFTGPPERDFDEQAVKILYRHPSVKLALGLALATLEEGSDQMVNGRPEGETDGQQHG